MTKIERVKKVCKWLIYTDFADNDKELATKLGYTKSSFSQIVNQKVKTSDKFLENLCKADENINKVWVFSGEGRMLLNNDYPNEESRKEKVINEPDLVYGPSDDQEKGIPLIPVDALAGFGLGEQQVQESDVTEYYRVPLLQERGAKFVIPVAGNSMYPKYNSGDLIACRPIKDFSFVQWGKPYVLDTEQGVIVKRLFENTEDAESLICKSDNTVHFPPFSIPRSSIYKVAIVIGVVGLD